MEEMAQSVRHVSLVDRADCRQAFEARFTTGRMVQDYVRVYEQMLGIPAKTPVLSEGETSGLTTASQG